MLYIVSGQPRCGTSAMIQFLMYGGIDCNYSKPDSDSNAKDHNEEGYYYCPNGNFEPHGTVTKANTDGKCVKLMGDALSKSMDLAQKASNNKCEFFVIIMHRRPDEVEISRKKCNMIRPTRKSIDSIISELGRREDVKGYILVDYGDLIESPEHIANKLVKKGVPIDPEKAIHAIDPKLYRNKVD